MSTDRWWTFPAESENGKTVMVTGRDNIDKFRDSGKYVYRIDVSWKYNALPDGMPEEDESRLMEQVTDRFIDEFKKDKVGVLTGIYTGDGCRDWVFYCKNLAIFNKVFNRALEELPTIPLLIEAEEDSDWEEYSHMKDETYIPDEQ